MSNCRTKFANTKTFDFTRYELNLENVTKGLPQQTLAAIIRYASTSLGRNSRGNYCVGNFPGRPNDARALLE